MKRLCILGSTGSIGKSALAVVRLHPAQFSIEAITANTNLEELLAQIIEFKPRYAVVADARLALEFAQTLRAEGLLETSVLSGTEGLVQASTDDGVDTVIAAIVGAAGLPATLAAAQAGKQILLANKEVLVCAGSIFMAAVKSSGAQILPLDSEHNAIFQCWPSQRNQSDAGIRRVILTASGGPFLGWDREQLQGVTPEQAFRHPNWEMGKKISVDSATMMNKGLELIEATWLFDLPVDQIEILVHPQSVVHSLVEYTDGSQLAQLASADMRTPIAHALGYPNRISSGAPYLDLTSAPKLEFYKPDLKSFDCLRVALEAAAQGGTAPLFLNAANEVAVDAFIQRRIAFIEIAELVEKTVEMSPLSEPVTLAEVIELDEIARQYCRQLIEKRI